MLLKVVFSVNLVSCYLARIFRNRPGVGFLLGTVDGVHFVLILVHDFRAGVVMAEVAERLIICSA